MSRIILGVLSSAQTLVDRTREFAIGKNTAAALESTRYHRTKAVEKLGISSKTLSKK